MGASRIAMLSIMITGITSLIVIHVYGVDATPVGVRFSGKKFNRVHLQKMEELKASLARSDSVSSRARHGIPMRSLQQAPVPSPVSSEAKIVFFLVGPLVILLA